MDSKKSMELLHQRFGHMGMITVKLLANKLDVGIEINAKDLSSYDRVACAAGKAKRMSYARFPVRNSKPLETLMMEICSMSEPTIDGSSMFLFVIEESTRYKWTYLLKNKSDAESHVTVLLNRLAGHFAGKTVLRLRSDQGGEFSSNVLIEFCDTLGIGQTFTNAYSPQENGFVERVNGVVLPRLRAMLAATHLPSSLWGGSLLHVMATLNRLPTKPLGLVPPHQKLFKTEPALDDLRTWGCIAHVRVPPNDNTIGYKFMDLVTAQVVTARSGNNAFADGDHNLPETVPVARIKTSMDTYHPDRTAASACTTKQLDIVLPEGQPTEHVQSSVDCQQDADLPACDSVESQPAAASPTNLQDPAKAPDGVAKAGAHRKRSRRKKPVVVEKETSGVAIEAPPTEPCLKRPRRKQKAHARLSDYVIGHVQATTDMQISTTYKQAGASKFWPQWRAAMLAELQSLKDHMTWKLVPRTVTKKTKQLGINYTETCAPVIRFETIRAAIYYAIQREWLVLQYDVKTAFLYDDLDELIFMEQPPGFQIEGHSMVCRLLKSLYGLNQVPNIWNKTLHAKLLVMGLARLDSDYGFYALKKDGEVTLLLTVYVDDLLLMGPSKLCEEVAASLQETFELTTMGACSAWRFS
ncbi:hypothetical protein PF005_g6545 [Phytophthora fragariae]|uniref:Integrase catalytic domain-containing protein n=1 Tax=Phytophthora fragariae TaxID=53985 RepID=A0A6A3LUY8_9STRA|nr:hypothetical protein PF011_g4653 [Phytophthora fragariae]KAE9222807.1 hypothetical protein PF005_g6545 [Phytophthora fragariae]KAE9247090.1 hypothetical protein PF002_g6432 [Phytophthora fragariae]